MLVLLVSAGATAAEPGTGTATSEQIENGYRLANDAFKAVIAFEGPATGVTRLRHRGAARRQEIDVRETPLALRLATDAERIDIVNWFGHAGSGQAVPPEAEWGYQLGLHKSAGGGAIVQRLTDNPLGSAWYTDIYYPGYYWYRQTIALPKEWEGKPVVFVLGGCDGYDWRNYWVYLNGERIGQSSFDDTYDGPWHETPRYVLKPGDAGYAQLKFGQPNALAVQARRLDRRTARMNRLDLERYSGQSLLCDQYVSGGEPTEDLTGFQVIAHKTSVADGVAAVELELKHPEKSVSITARYWLNPDDAALHKRIVVRNTGDAPITLLEADVLNLNIEQLQVAGGGQGWPCRIGDDWFAGVSHPAGLARHGKDGVRLQVLPGSTLDPAHGRDYVSKTAVVGVGNGRRAFADYLAAHCRRKPRFLNMYALYGLTEIATGLFSKIELTEELLLKNVEQMRALQKRGIKFDYYCIDTGWNDPVGDLKSFYPAHFPKGPEKSLKAIRDLGMKPLLWMSPAAGPAVFRAGVENPHIPPGGDDNTGMGANYCLAGDKWRTMLREAMLHHVRENGVRGFKLDEVSFYCGRSNHGHLPNKYGVEQEMDAFIHTLDSVRDESPDVLIMLYWRFMSPWWLLHADTIYQRGLQMEGATPSAQPTRLTRQSATISLDQGHDWNWDTMPLLGQDSLGVWLSNTRWGSWMGAEGWRDAWVMDFVRGNMMHQLWGDLGLLTKEDVQFMETIAAWTRENSDLLRHPKRILGSPWREEPYGYACCNGDRGLIVIHNANFAANTVRIALDDAIGLERRAYEVRWVYKAGSVKVKQRQIVPAGGLLEVPLGSFEVCMADISPADAPAKSDTPLAAIPSRAGARRLSTRFLQTSSAKLDWSDSKDQKLLARIVNGRTRPTLTPDVLAVGPDMSDERDRDAVKEKLAASVTFPMLKTPSKLLVVTRFDRDGIAWHHLAPFTIVRVTATCRGKPLEGKTTPRIVHEQAGGWSWMLHEFEVPPGCGSVELRVDAGHPQTVSLAMEVWHSDE